MTIYAPSRDVFHSLLRIAASSIAEPAWFAAPVDAEEDAESITVVFHVPEERHGSVRVEASDQSVTVRGGRRRDRRPPMRLCALPCPIVARAIETARSGDLLRVRVPKKPPAADTPEASTPST